MSALSLFDDVCMSTQNAKQQSSSCQHKSTVFVDTLFLASAHLSGHLATDTTIGIPTATLKSMLIKSDNLQLN
jgi:hypothetical protein